MKIKVGINGMGRIGRMIVRSIIENNNKNIEIKHINNRTSSETCSTLLKYDSIHGRFNAEVGFDEKHLTINKNKITFSQETDLDNIKLERILDGKIKALPIVNSSQFDNIKANDLDAIFIREFSFRYVEISGAVLNPGIYLMNEGDSVKDVIEKSGGLTNNSYAFGTVYQNETARAISEQAAETLYKSSMQNISEIIKMGGDTDFTPLIAVLTELKESGVSGRVVIDLNSNEQPTLVQDGDTILVPEKTNQVYVFGSISDAGSALYTKGQDFKYYIDKKGGLTSNADSKNIFVLHPNGETYKLKIKKNLFASFDNKIEIYPGSVIYVPESLDNGYQTRLQTQAYASILGSLGVSLASLSVLKD